MIKEFQMSKDFVQQECTHIVDNIYDVWENTPHYIAYWQQLHGCVVEKIQNKKSIPMFIWTNKTKTFEYTEDRDILCALLSDGEVVWWYA